MKFRLLLSSVLKKTFSAAGRRSCDAAENIISTFTSFLKPFPSLKVKEKPQPISSKKANK